MGFAERCPHHRIMTGGIRTSKPLSGEPLTMLLDGRFPVRDDRVIP